MNEKGEILIALTDFVKRKSKVNQTIVCTVHSYDSVNKTCYCYPVEDLADIPNVRVNANPATDGLTIIPKLNSFVLVSFLENGSAYISMFSEVEEIHLAGISYGGIAKTADITTKLNNLETKVNQLVTAMAAWVVVPNDGGAALKTLLATFYGSSLTPTTQASISSTIVKHGNNT